MDLFEERGFGFADFSVAVVFNFSQPCPSNELCPAALGSFGLISRDLIWTQSGRTHTACKQGGQEACAEAGGLGGQPGAQSARTGLEGWGRGCSVGGGAGASSEGVHKHSPVGVGLERLHGQPPSAPPLRYGFLSECPRPPQLPPPAPQSGNF